MLLFVSLHLHRAVFIGHQSETSEKATFLVCMASVSARFLGGFDGEETFCPMGRGG